MQILNTEYKLLTIVENTSKSLSLFSAELNESLQPYSELLFTVPEKEIDSLYIKIGNYVAYKDTDKVTKLFVISMIEEINANEKEVTCEHISTELSDEHVQALNRKGSSAIGSMQAILEGSEWKLGVVDNFYAQNFSIYYTNKLDALTTCADKYKGELLFETKLVEGVLTKTVHLVKSRGTYSGKRFEYGKDILSIRRTVDMSQIKTAIYGYGASSVEGDETSQRLTFADVVWSEATGQTLNKPKGQTFIGDDKAMALYGLEGGTKHRFGMLDAGEVTDPEVLIILSNAYLQKVNKPKVTYEMSVIELERVAGYEHERVRLGDTVIVLDYEFQEPIKITARVVEIKRDLMHPEKTDIVLGNFKEVFTDIYDKVKDLEDSLNNNTGIWNSKLDTMDLSHYAEFGSVIYDGNSDTTLTFNYSQIYTEIPVIHAQIQLIDEELDDITEYPQLLIKPVMMGQFYAGGQVKVIRGDTTDRRFLVTMHSYCSSPEILA